MQITIDTNEIAELVAEADEILVSASGEEALLRLMEIQETVNSAVEDAKKQLEQSALRLNPNFRSIRGDRVKVSYRPFGAAYEYDENKLANLLKADFVDRSIKYTLNTKAIKTYIKTNGQLPQGITPKPRRKRIVIQGVSGE